MKTQKGFIYLQILVIVLFSCTSNHTNSTKKTFKFVAEPQAIEDNVSFSNIVEEYKYVVLETTTESLIGNVEKLIVHNSRIYIHSGGIFCFDMNGNFLYTINKRGKGPGEFIKINSLSIDNNIIYIYDNSLAKILCYNTRNGNFIKSYKIPYSVPSIEVLDSMLYIDTHQFPKSMFPDSFNGGERLFRLSFDNLLKPLNKFFPEKRFKMIMEGQSYIAGDKYYFVDPYMLESYQSEKNEMIPFFSINWPSKKLSKADILELINNRLTTKQLLNQNKAFAFKNIFETHSQIYSNAIINAKGCFLIYEKKSNKCRVINCMKIKREGYQPNLSYGGIKCIYGEYICTISSYNLIKFTNFNLNNLKEKGNERKEVLKLRSINENSNPVISLIKIKPLN